MQRNRQIQKKRNIETERTKDRETDKKRDSQAERQLGRETARQLDRDTERQRKIQTEKDKYRDKERQIERLSWMKQEGMTFDHDFCYFILLFSSLLRKEGREKENDVAKIVIKSHTFLFHH